MTHRPRRILEVGMQFRKTLHLVGKVNLLVANRSEEADSRGSVPGGLYVGRKRDTLCFAADASLLLGRGPFAILPFHTIGDLDGARHFGRGLKLSHKGDCGRALPTAISCDVPTENHLIPLH